MGAFIGDYRPTKRVGVEELDGCIRMLTDKIDEMEEAGEAGSEYYIGALLALECVRHGNYEYPRELVWVLEEKIKGFD